MSVCLDIIPFSPGEADFDYAYSTTEAPAGKKQLVIQIINFTLGLYFLLKSNLLIFCFTDSFDVDDVSIFLLFIHSDHI